MTPEEITSAIEGLENFPLTENQQRLVYYLRVNIDDLRDCFTDLDL